MVGWCQTFLDFFNNPGSLCHSLTETVYSVIFYFALFTAKGGYK